MDLFFFVSILNSKRNANVCSDPFQSHYDKKLIHDNRSTSQNEIRAKCSLDICLSNCTVFTHASSKQISQRQNMVNFYSIKHRKSNLRFFCCSVYLTSHDLWIFIYIYLIFFWGGGNFVILILLIVPQGRKSTIT